MIKIALIFLTLFSVWITRDLFRPEFFRSHDALYHVVRLDQFHKSFISGQIPVRWAPDLLNGLGYPLFIVNYHLPYYLAEAFHLLGLSLFAAIKAVFIVSLTASALTGFWLFYSWTKKPAAAALGAVFYILAPYRLANIFERGALGEALAYIFVPLVFLGLDRIKHNRSLKLFAFALVGLTLSHTVVAITFAPVFLVYILYTKPHLASLIKGSVLAFGLSGFQLFPVLFERQFMRFDANLLTAYQGHFKSIYQLLRIPYPGINIGTPFQVGLTHLLVVLVSLFSFARGGLAKLGFFIIVFAISLFLITPASRFLWDNLPGLPLVLYPWRFLGVVAFATASLVALLIACLPAKAAQLLAGLLLLTVLFTNRHYIRVDEFIAPVFPQEMLAGNATTQNEFDPIYPDKLGSPGKETPIRQAGNWLSVFSLLLWLLL